VLHYLDAVEARHLEVKEHQLDRAYVAYLILAAPSGLSILNSLRNALLAHVEGIFAVDAEVNQVNLLAGLELGFDDFHVD